MRFFRSSIPIVEKLEQKKNVKELIRALQHEQKDVRKEAAEALGKIGDARAVEPLIQALKDNDEEVRQKAAAALIKLRP